MSNGALFGLRASFETAETVSKLIPGSSKLNSADNKQNAQAVLGNFKDKVNKLNDLDLKVASINRETGGLLDVYA